MSRLILVDHVKKTCWNIFQQMNLHNILVPWDASKDQNLRFAIMTIKKRRTWRWVFCSSKIMETSWTSKGTVPPMRPCFLGFAGYPWIFHENTNIQLVPTCIIQLVLHMKRWTPTSSQKQRPERYETPRTDPKWCDPRGLVWDRMDTLGDHRSPEKWGILHNLERKMCYFSGKIPCELLGFLFRVIISDWWCKTCWNIGDANHAGTCKIVKEISLTTKPSWQAVPLSAHVETSFAFFFALILIESQLIC